MGGRTRDGGTADVALKRRACAETVDWRTKESLTPNSEGARLQGPENAKEMRCLKGVNLNDIKSLIAGGEGGIRTHGTVTRTTVFETAPSQMRIGEGKRGGCSP